MEIFATAAVYGNLAQCRLKLETYGTALADADKALELDSTYIKAYYRKGSAFMALGKFKDALRQFAAVVKAKPKSKSAKQKLKQCKKIIQRERFLKAIETEMTKPASETYDLETLIVRYRLVLSQYTLIPKLTTTTTTTTIVGTRHLRRSSAQIR